MWIQFVFPLQYDDGNDNEYGKQTKLYHNKYQHVIDVIERYNVVFVNVISHIMSYYTV